MEVGVLLAGLSHLNGAEWSMPAWYKTRMLRTTKGGNFQKPMTTLCKGRITAPGAINNKFNEPTDPGSAPASAPNALASWLQAGHVTLLHHRFLLSQVDCWKIQ